MVAIADSAISHWNGNTAKVVMTVKDVSGNVNYVTSEHFYIRNLHADDNTLY